MAGPDLDTVASRTRILLETAPPSDVSDLRTAVVEPLLLALDWPVRGPTVDSDVQIGSTTVEYLLSIDDVPALLVAVDWQIDPDRTDALLEQVTEGAVERGLYVDRDEVLVLDSPEPTPVALRSLDEEAAALEACRRSVLAGELEGTDRRRAVQRISRERETVVDEVTGALTDVAGDEMEDTFRRTATAFVDRLMEVLQTRPVDAAPQEEPEPTAVEETSTDDDEEGDSTPPPESLEDAEGEYVAKFFDGPTSIGAVGDSTSVGAFVGAVEYLLEGHLADVRPPWPAEGAVILNDEPRQRSGEHMAAAREIGDGVYLEVGGSVADRADRLETLAAQAGLRVMFTGDW